MTASGDTPAEIGTKLTENCELVSNWMQGNKFKLNAGKTHLMTVGTGARLRIQTLLSGWMGSSWKKVLRSLKGHRQIQELTAKLKKRLIGLAHLRNILRGAFQTKKRGNLGLF